MGKNHASQYANFGSLQVEIQQVQELFTKVAGSPMLYTKDSPDELKPKIK